MSNNVTAGMLLEFLPDVLSAANNVETNGTGSGSAVIGNLGIEWGRVGFSLPTANVAVSKTIQLENDYETIPIPIAGVGDSTPQPHLLSVTAFPTDTTGKKITVRALASAGGYSWNVAYIVIGKVKTA